MRIKEDRKRTVIDTDKNCAHYWIIESPKGPWSLATCRKCKKIDAFRNSQESSGWGLTAKIGNERVTTQPENTRVSKTKEEFLTEKGPQFKAKKYETIFKIKAVQEVKIHGRLKIRKKYGIAETTLRGWIKTYGEEKK